MVDLEVLEESVVQVQSPVLEDAGLSVSQPLLPKVTNKLSTSLSEVHTENRSEQ